MHSCYPSARSLLVMIGSSLLAIGVAASARADLFFDVRPVGVAAAPSGTGYVADVTNTPDNAITLDVYAEIVGTQSDLTQQGFMCSYLTFMKTLANNGHGLPGDFGNAAGNGSYTYVRPSGQQLFLDGRSAGLDLGSTSALPMVSLDLNVGWWSSASNCVNGIWSWISGMPQGGTTTGIGPNGAAEFHLGTITFDAGSYVGCLTNAGTYSSLLNLQPAKNKVGVRPYAWLQDIAPGTATKANEIVVYNGRGTSPPAKVGNGDGTGLLDNSLTLQYVVPLSSPMAIAPAGTLPLGVHVGQTTQLGVNVANLAPVGAAILTYSLSGAISGGPFTADAGDSNTAAGNLHTFNFTPSTTGRNSFTVTAHNLAAPNNPRTTTVDVYAYSGQGTWTSLTNGSWNDLTNWSLPGGIPGMAGPIISVNDTATLVGSNSNQVIELDGENLHLNGLTRNATDNIRIESGAVNGGSITMVQSGNDAGSCYIYGNITIAVPVVFSSSVWTSAVFTSSVSGSGGMTAGGGAVLAGTSTFTGSTDITGSLEVDGPMSAAPANITVEPKGTLIANTSIPRAIVGMSGSTITATSSSVALGDPGSPTGFVSSGTLTTSANVVTLNSMSRASLGQYNSLAGGTLAAQKGFLLDSGGTLFASPSGTVTGGTAARFLNQGFVLGPSGTANNWLTFNLPYQSSGGTTMGKIAFRSGFIAGVGPAVDSQYGSMILGASATEFDLGGPNPGNTSTSYSQLSILVNPNDSRDLGNLTLLPGTVINVDDWNSFVPGVGEQFTLLTWAGTLSGSATLHIDPAFLNQSISFKPIWGANSLIVQAVAVPEPATLALLGMAGVLMIVGIRRRRCVANE